MGGRLGYKVCSFITVLTLVLLLLLYNDQSPWKIRAFKSEPKFPTANTTMPNLKINMKVYVYDLPSKFNKDLEDMYRDHLNSKYDLSHDAYGNTVTSYDGMAFRNTYQGILDIIFHKRLLASGLLTMDPEDADLFYIPYYYDMTFKELPKDRDFDQTMLFNTNLINFHFTNKTSLISWQLVGQ